MRTGKAKKRAVNADLLYKSRSITRLINVVMLDGKKATAEGIVYGALGKISEEKKDALQVFEDALRNVMPKQEVRSRRVGGTTYQVPMPVKHDRSEALALRWLVNAARKKSGKAMEERLFDELKNAAEGTGEAMKKREETHKMAEANRAFAHFKF